MERLAPVYTAELIAALNAELVRLLRGLEDADWLRPTVAGAWRVRDVAAHLLDGDLRRLSGARDAQPPPPGTRIDSYAALVGLIDRQNAEGVEYARRLSPRVITDLLEVTGGWVAEYFAALPPHGEAVWPVAWAGEARSENWMDVGRDYTERWHHQAQIRLATGAPPLVAAELSEPVFDTFLRALPHRYAAVGAGEGATVGVAIHGAATYAYTLRRERGAWSLLKRRDGSVQVPGVGASAGGATASIEIAEQPAWLLLTKGMTGDRARAEARVAGDERLVAPFFGTLAVMA